MRKFFDNGLSLLAVLVVLSGIGCRIIQIHNSYFFNGSGRDSNETYVLMIILMLLLFSVYVVTGQAKRETSRISRYLHFSSVQVLLVLLTGLVVFAPTLSNSLESSGEFTKRFRIAFRSNGEYYFVTPGRRVPFWEHQIYFQRESSVTFRWVPCQGDGTPVPFKALVNCTIDESKAASLVEKYGFLKEPGQDADMEKILEIPLWVMVQSPGYIEDKAAADKGITEWIKGQCEKRLSRYYSKVTCTASKY